VEKRERAKARTKLPNEGGAVLRIGTDSGIAATSRGNVIRSPAWDFGVAQNPPNSPEGFQRHITNEEKHSIDRCLLVVVPQNLRVL